MKYRLSDLKNFVETAGQRTISEAARVIGISQPALSESLKRLEADLGLVLLFRTRTGISPSPEGRKLHLEAKSLLDRLSTIATAQPHQNTAPLPIRIGAHSIIAAWIVPLMTQNLKLKDYSFEISHGLSRNVQSQIQKGELDIGIVVNPLSAPGLVSKKIASDHVSVWHSRRAKDAKLLFCDLNLIQTQDILRRWSKRLPYQIVHSTSLEFVVEMVKSGTGLGILPDKSLGHKPAHLSKMDKTPVYRDLIHLMYRPEFGRTPYERAFLDALYAASSREES